MTELDYLSAIVKQLEQIDYLLIAITSMVGGIWFMVMAKK